MCTCKRIIILLLLVLGWGIYPTVAQQTDAEQTVEDFYTWYLDYVGYDTETDTFHNPIDDGSFRDRPELSAALVAEIDAEEVWHHDPFLCAQDLPENVTFKAFDEEIVLVNMYYGFNPHPHTLSVELDDNGLITAVNCRETITVHGTVETFYMTYILDRENVQIGENPLLTDALNAQLAQTLDSTIPLGEGDPVICAQDRATYVQADPVSIGDDTATMLVRTFFANNPTPRLLVVDLVLDDRWQLDAITCDVPPETVATYIYNEFVTYKRYDLENGLERIPLDNWARYPWDTLLSDTLYDELMTVYLSGDPTIADPFLCAQDLPERISTSRDSDDVIVSGAFASGEGTYIDDDLARLTMTQSDDGLWQITDITCVP